MFVWPPLGVRLLALPALLFAPVMPVLLLAHSESPVVLGRYSVPLFALLVWTLCLYATFAYALRTRHHGIGQLAIAAFALTTLAVTANNQVLSMWGVQVLLPMARLACAFALIGRELLRSREGKSVGGGFVMLAMLVGLFALADLALLGALQLRQDPERPQSSIFRLPVDLSSLPPESIVVIGDSFVWGQGVSLRESFPSQLQVLCERRGRVLPVVNLGRIGTNVRAYNELLKTWPAERKVEQIVVGFYANDMPEKERWAQRLRSQTRALAHSAPSLRVLVDMLETLTTPTPQAYLKQVVEDHDRNSPSYGGRWRRLQGQLATNYALTRQRSRQSPLLLLPIMSDYEPYPLADSHRAVLEMAGRMGFETLDMWPPFAERLGNGVQHWVAPDDPHMDGESHALVAHQLAGAICQP